MKQSVIQIHSETRQIPNALLDRVALVVLEIGVEFLQLEGSLLVGGFHPLGV